MAAGVVKSMAQPPFLDRLEHKERQARAEQAIQEQMPQFNREQLQQIAERYRSALWPWSQKKRAGRNPALLLLWAIS